MTRATLITSGSYLSTLQQVPVLPHLSAAVGTAKDGRRYVWSDLGATSAIMHHFGSERTFAQALLG